VNGLVFSDSTTLSQAMHELLGHFPPSPKSTLSRLVSGVAGLTRWEENWEAHAAPVFRERGRWRTGGLIVWLSVILFAVCLAFGLSVVHSS
jgi:hypothetical protein